MADVVRIELGSSILEGEQIAMEARAAGLKVEFLLNRRAGQSRPFALSSR